MTYRKALRIGGERMSIKYFCDDCGKELKFKGYGDSIEGNGWDNVVHTYDIGVVYEVGDKLYKLGVLMHGKRLPYEVGEKTSKNYYKVHRVERGKDVLDLKHLVALAKVFDHEVIIRPKPKLSTIEGAERMMNFMLGEK